MTKRSSVLPSHRVISRSFAALASISATRLFITADISSRTPFHQRPFLFQSCKAASLPGCTGRGDECSEAKPLLRLLLRVHLRPRSGSAHLLLQHLSDMMKLFCSSYPP